MTAHREWIGLAPGLFVLAVDGVPRELLDTETRLHETCQAALSKRFPDAVAAHPWTVDERGNFRTEVTP